MATKRLTRLVIPVELDDSKTASTLTNLKEVITQTSQQISRSMEKALPVADITNASINIIRSIGSIQASAKTAAAGIKSETDKIGNALQGAFGVDATKASSMMQKFLEMRGVERAVTQLKRMQREYGLTSAEAIEFAKSINASDEVLRRFADTQERTKQGGRGVSGLLTPYSLTSGVQAAAGAVGVSFGMYGMVELTKSVFNATTALDSLQLSFKSIYGESAVAEQSLGFVRKVSDELGLSFIDTAQAAKALFASAKGTVLENDAQMIFKSFSQMGVALKLTGEQMNSVFLAISQMISKGKVSAEELRLQLSERMPGAVNLFAKAIGVTTKQLDDMLQKGEVGLEHLRTFAEEVGKTYAKGAEEASHGLQAELNRLATAWFDLKSAMMDSEGAAAFIRVLTEITKFIGQNIDSIMNFVKWIGIVYTTLKVTTAFGVAVDALKNLRTAFTLTGVAAAETSGIMKAAQAVIAKFALAFNANPIALTVTALVAVGTAAYALSNQMSDSEKFISGYAKSFDEIASKSEKAAASQNNLSNSNKRLQEQYLSGEYVKRQMDFIQALQELPTALASTKVMSIFDAFSFDNEPEALYDFRRQAVNLAKETRDAIDKALNEETDPKARDEMIKNTLDRFKIMFRTIKDGMKEAGASEEVIKQWDNFGGAILNAKDTADAAKAALEALTGEANKSGNSIAKFAEAYEAIRKGTKTTEFGKQLAGQEDFETQIRGLLQMSEAQEQLENKTRNLLAAYTEQQNANTLTEEKMRELESAFDSMSSQSGQLDNAFRLVAEAAVSSGADASTLDSIIEKLGETFHLSSQDIDEFRTKLNSALSVAALQSAEQKLAAIEGKLATVGSKTSRAALTTLSSMKELQKGQEKQILEAIESGDFTNLLNAQGNKIAADVAKVYKEIAEKSEALVAAEDANRKAKRDANKKPKKIPEFDIEGFDVRVQKLFGTETNFAKIVEAEIEKLNASLATHKLDIKKVAEIYKDELPDGLHSVSEAQEFLSNKLKEGLFAKQAEKEKKAVDDLREKLMDFERAYSEIVSGDKGEAALKSYEKQSKQWKDTAEKLYRSISNSAFSSAEERIAAEQEYADTVVRIDEWMAEQRIRTSGGVLDNLKLGIKDYYDQHKNYALGLGEVVTSTTDSMAAALSDFVVGGMRDFKSFGEAFDSLVNDMIRSLSKLLAQQLMSGILQSALGLFTGGIGGGGGADNAVSFSSWFGGINRKANGGVMTGISGHSNSIVTSPTLFSYGKEISQYANGAGLMGEAGPEAIMPLTRTSSGKLGVISKRENESSRPTSSSSSEVFVNVYNSTGQKAQTKQTQNANGSKSIDVIIGDVAAQQMLTPGTKANYAIRTQTGATPPTIKR